jgi:aryl-alcohol dehydrogenase-like predicted oxidoreductase
MEVSVLGFGGSEIGHENASSETVAELLNDTLQTSINIADQEALDLTLPLARQKQMGVIAKRPVANAAWKTGHRPIDSHHHEYCDRFGKLNYGFLHEDCEKGISIALRFTLSVPSVHTAIVGTKRPARWEQNATLVERGRLNEPTFQKIRERREECEPRTWIGQI